MITKKQAEARRHSIGSSDAACVLGISPYGKTLYDLWLEKTGRASGFEGNDATRRGEYLEDGILKYAADKLGRVVKPSGAFTFKYEGVTFRAHVDGMVGKYAKGSTIVEAKNMVFDNDEWGQDGTDQIPIHVYAQVQHQMLCAESPMAYVARLGAFGFSLHPVEADPEFQRALLEKGVAFWYFVEADEPPPLDVVSEKTVSYIQQAYKASDTQVEIDDDNLRMYRHWKEVEEEALERQRYHKARIMERLGDAKRGVGQDFQVSMVKGGGYQKLDTKALQEAHPDLCEQFMSDVPVYHYPRVTERKKK
jgi:putative phage-type endonuclease